ncbi:MAG: asparaginase [Defluviitaleaceae bacterium]|nr:asparaginase [Defluviitaleaceae bacterium]
MKKKILVVETGGTFATSSVNSVRTLENYDSGKTIYDYEIVKEKSLYYNIEFEKIRPIFTLSENMTFELLNKLLKALYEIDYSKYIGVIISHGTDTLAYTANILSMLFSHKGIPFIMVSSNHPLNHPLANGVDNFAAALDFINCVKIQGVFVIYKDHEGVFEIHLGSRIKQMNQIIDSYESFKNVNFGKLMEGKFVHNNDEKNPTIDDINTVVDPKSAKGIELTKTVMIIYPYVGLRFDLFNINEALSAVVYGVYHSGTFCAPEFDSHNSINRLVEKLKKYDIPLYISEISSGSDKYASTESLKNDDIINIAYDTSIENLYSKVAIAFDLFEDAGLRNDYIKNSNIFFEKVV